MSDVSTLLQASHRRRVRRRAGGALAVAALMAGTYLAADGRQRATPPDDAGVLREWLAHRKARLARQRGEMTQVVAAIERLTQRVAELDAYADQARAQVHLEESLGADPAPFLVATDADGFEPAGRDAAWVLAQLQVLDEWAGAASDSMALVTALMSARSTRDRADVPSRWPVQGRVTSPFGNRHSPYDGQPEMHAGIDIRAGYGAPVTSSADGTVLFAGRDAGYGRLVVVDHGADVDTFYGHLSDVFVRTGEKVRRGQAIGAVGSSGRATGAHLHYEVRVRNRPVNPRGYLRN